MLGPASGNDLYFRDSDHSGDPATLTWRSIAARRRSTACPHLVKWWIIAGTTRLRLCRPEWRRSQQWRHRLRGLRWGEPPDLAEHEPIARQAPYASYTYDQTTGHRLRHRPPDHRELYRRHDRSAAPWQLQLYLRHPWANDRPDADNDRKRDLSLDLRLQRRGPADEPDLLGWRGLRRELRQRLGLAE